MEEPKECSICTTEYDTTSEKIPRVLQCGHSFCTYCIRQICTVSYRSPGCPQCRHPIILPQRSSLEVLLVVNKSLMNALNISISDNANTSADTELYETEYALSQSRNYMPRFNYHRQRRNQRANRPPTAVIISGILLGILKPLGSLVLFICFIVAFTKGDSYSKEAKGPSICLFIHLVIGIICILGLIYMMVSSNGGNRNDCVPVTLAIGLGLNILFGLGISIWTLIVLINHNNERTLLFYLLASTAAYCGVIWLLTIFSSVGIIISERQ